MCQILKKLVEVDSNNSEAVKEVLTSFFQHLPKRKDVERNTWLHALLKVISRYPKYCSTHRNNIEEYLCYYLDSDYYFQVIEAAKCSHAIQQVRPFQDRTASAKTCWKDQMNLLCRAAHLLIDAIFHNAVDMYKGISGVEEPPSNSPFSNTLRSIAKVPHNANRKSFLILRLRNIFVFIQAMLVEIYPVVKSIEAQLILDLILRAQSVSSSKKMNEELCNIKIEALRTLDALNACLGSNLLPFSPLVIRFVMQTLRWSSDNPSEEASKVRAGAYNSMRGWLQTLGCHRAPLGRDNWQHQLTEHVVGDITPEKKLVQLTIGSQPMKKLSKKAKRKQANAMLKESAIAAHMPGEKNKTNVDETVSNDVALAALNCAEAFLTVCGRFLKPTTHKIYQECLVRECFSSDYSDEHLLGLLRVLEACRKSVPSGIPPPTQYCLHLYSALMNRQTPEISQFCSQALLDIRLHLHYSPPSLTFNVEGPQDKQDDTNKRKKISDKNKSALESLLGRDRMSEVNSEIVQDEPSPKKPRLDTDNITISSTGSSVVISDESDDDDVEEVDVVAQIHEMSITKEQTDETTSKEVENSKLENVNNASIHEAVTQIPNNITNDMIDGKEGQMPMEVAADYSNTEIESFPLLKEVDDDDDNVPSTNESDDVQITCGQEMKLSQELMSDKLSHYTVDQVEGPKINGSQSDEIVENGLSVEILENVSQNGIDNIDEVVKIPSKDGGISVDDMLADFVDEVNDDIATA